MLGEFCYWIVNMSITASVTGLIVMAARKIKAVPRRFSVFLWIIPFVRMWVPFGLNSRYSLMTLISQLTTKTVTIYQPADDIAFSVTNTLMLADSYFPNLDEDPEWHAAAESEEQTYFDLEYKFVRYERNK